jgi:hypothetical protein
MYLYLDDIRRDAEVSHNETRGLGLKVGQSNDWTIARDYFQFENFINKNFDKIELISFDHDICSFDENGKELTGKDAANLLIDYCIDNQKELPDWFVHSDNNSGNKNIRQLLINYMYRVENRLDQMTDAFGYFNNTLIFTK